jgi:hypothetical protein
MKSPFSGGLLKMNEQGLTIRKISTVMEETHVEAERKLDKPVRKAAAIAVIKNPFAGRYSEDLSPLYEYGGKLGDLLAKVALEALQVKQEDAGERIHSYGKSVVVGVGGELEHAHAIMHPKLGAPLRKVLGGADACKAIIPSTAKVGPVGESIDIPLHYKGSEWVFSHFDTMKVAVPDAPRADEILVALAITDSGRPLARIGGLQKDEANSSPEPR